MSGSQTISIATADGATLAADIVEPPHPSAAAVLCHPHPAYGGDRFNMVTQACFDALADRGQLQGLGHLAQAQEDLCARDRLVRLVGLDLADLRRGP